MVQRKVTRLVDDIDGSSAAESVRFGVDGVGFEIDLSAENAADLRRAFSPWMRSASIRRGCRAGLMANAPVASKDGTADGSDLLLDRSTRNESLPQD